MRVFLWHIHRRGVRCAIRLRGELEVCDRIEAGMNELIHVLLATSRLSLASASPFNADSVSLQGR